MEFQTFSNLPIIIGAIILVLTIVLAVTLDILQRRSNPPTKDE